MTSRPNKKLEDISRQVRQDILRMTHQAGSGHPGGSLSVTDILVSLYFSKLKHNPQKPQWDERDYMILSKGHGCPALYSCLAHSGYFPVEELMTLRKPFSRLQGHPAKDKGLPGIEVSSGSLGQGLSISVGVSLGLRLANKDPQCFCVMSDGEQEEGSTWEAVMAAGFYKLDHLTGIIDYNKLQQEDFIANSMEVAPLGDKYRAFNWNVLEVNGHKFDELLNAIDQAGQHKGQPTVIIAHTVKGKGVSFMENVPGWHGKAPDQEQLKKALEELEESVDTKKGSQVRV